MCAMKNTNNRKKMKKFMKMTFAVVAIAVVGLGSYKAYGSYTAANMSEEDLLVAENILALSDPGGSNNDEEHIKECWIRTGESLNAKHYSCSNGDEWSCVKERRSPSCSTYKYKGCLGSSRKYCWKN